MNKLIIPIILCILVLTPLCIGQGSDANKNDKIIVYATIQSQKEMIEAVGGDKVTVNIIVPPGDSPHTRDLTPSQLTDLAKARIYVMVGSGVEFEVKSIDKIRDLNKNMIVIDSSKGIELISIGFHAHEGEELHSEEEDGKDPHIWNSIKNGKTMVQNIYDGLILVDPDNKEYYLKNRDEYIMKLDEADQYIANELTDIPNRSFMIFHPSWGYFARDYNLTQIAIEVGGKEPTLQSLSHTIEEAKEENIKTVFVSPGFSSKAAEIITKEIGGKTEVLDPLAENYIENLKITANKIKNQ
ncbi:MAG: high-affinity zinc transporter periplasmic component [Candidatus Methanofastidiosum methylothiophilum]|uniref:High-affinity zinc transporter periplasmic component n=1 Tax=Candidatus Methanofastidiosum methylothiophilum TaxID=1705564 RepID=A0A150J5B3_9EURY|nr:MAG: high-affinity zinc transporter periplasmic component [Candidatus Methanofastidiosum methylthiophilus]